MTLGSQHRRASLHHQNTSDALRLLPASYTLNSLHQRDNSVFTDCSLDAMSHAAESECMLPRHEPRPNVTVHSSVVMERRRTIGARVGVVFKPLSTLATLFYCLMLCKFSPHQCVVFNSNILTANSSFEV